MMCCLNNFNVILLLFGVYLIHFTYSEDLDNAASDRADLNKINYYNWLLHRHRTEKAKIESLNKNPVTPWKPVINFSEYRQERLKKLQNLIETPVPRNVTLIATEENFSKVRQHLHPVNHGPVTSGLEALQIMLGSRSSAPKGGQQDGQIQSDTVTTPVPLVEFLLSETEYNKYGKFLRHKTIKKN